MRPWTLLLLLQLLAVDSATAQSVSAFSSAASIKFPLPDDCPTSCGNISIKYPFGLKDGCFRPGFNLFCDNSTHPPKLFLGNDTATQVFNMTELPVISFQLSSWPSSYWHSPFFVNPLSQVFNISRDDTVRTKEISWTTPGEGTPYVLSSSNVVMMVGCAINATLIDGETNEDLGNCTAICADSMDTIGGSGSCYSSLSGGCCEIQFPRNLKSVKIRFTKHSWASSNSTVVKILVGGYGIKPYVFKWQDLYDTQNISSPHFRGVLDWRIPNELNCESAQKDKANYACISDHSYCRNFTSSDIFGYFPSGLDLLASASLWSLSSTRSLGYRCYCQSVDGNAYIPNGCKAYKCRNRICSKLLLGLIIGISVGMALLLLIILTKFIIGKWKKVKQRKIKEKNFRQNHGLLLQQLISSNEDIAERKKIFSLEEIEKATNNFDVTRILGKGGHGTVYKGILVDQSIVAIKKSKIVKKDEVDQFINEVAILSHINHRNIVRLFGCCLEMEVPLLVYEFIPNGTLYNHLHSRDANPSLSWEDRLRIATEAAAALAYLHCAALISIFHRDVKSSNILLDDNLTAKVSDFGASRSIPNDETHIVTIVQGTYGYLDPQYYQTGELTGKSDVYSFGVILLELLIGKKPISIELFGEERNLTINFLQAINENRHFDLMDARVQVEGTKEELEYVSQLACMCINFESSARPTMKEVEYRLQILRRKMKQTQEHKEVIGKPHILVSSNDSHIAFMASSSNQANGEASQDYNMEKYLMSSLDLPR